MRRAADSDARPSRTGGFGRLMFKRPFRDAAPPPYIVPVRTRQGTTTMKATEVRILPALEPGESYVDPVFVLVETSLDACGETVTTIDHVSTKTVGGRDLWIVT